MSNICCIDCASVRIAGSGTSTLENLPDMFVGDLTLTGQIGPRECRSFGGFAIEYPNPGEATTVTKVQGIQFKKPTAGKCFTKASGNQSTTAAPSTLSSSTTASSSITTRTQGNVVGSECENSLSLIL